MAYNKITLNGETKIDLTQDTVTAEDVALGKTFHLNSGEQAVGTLEITSGGGSEEVITETYTDVTALKNKAIELLSNNRFCYLYIKGIKKYYASVYDWKFSATTITPPTGGSSTLIDEGSTNYFFPERVSSTATFVSGLNKVVLNASPSYTYNSVAIYDDDVRFTKTSESLQTLISGGNIEITLCYI